MAITAGGSKKSSHWCQICLASRKPTPIVKIMEGSSWWWQSRYPWDKAKMPTTKAIAIMVYSNVWLWIMLMPKSGRLLKKRGSSAQCIAQATEVVIPKASQFIFNRISRQIYTLATLLQNIEIKYSTKTYYSGTSLQSKLWKNKVQKG